MGNEADLEGGHSKLDESKTLHTKKAIHDQAQPFLYGPATKLPTGLPVLFYVAYVTDSLSRNQRLRMQRLWILLSCSITLLNKRLLDMRFGKAYRP